MKTGIPAPFHEALDETISGVEVAPNIITDPQLRHALATEYIGNLQEAFAVAEDPATDSAVENLSHAIFNKEASLERRREYANHALDLFKSGVINHAPVYGGFNVQAVTERAEELSGQFVEGVIAFAEASSAPDDKSKDGYKEKISFLFPEHKTPEDQAVMALTLLDVMQPYLVDRLLELDVYDPPHLREQLAEIQADCALMANFQRSAANFLEFASTGRRRKSDEEIGLSSLELVKGPKTFIDDGKHKFFVQWYRAQVDKNSEVIRLQEDEVESYTWINVDALIEDVIKNPKKYVPSMQNSMETLGVM